MKFYWRRYLDAGAPGGGGGANPEKDALLKDIKKQVGEELEKRGYQNAEAVTGIMTKALEGLNIDALRGFDPTKISDSVRNLAAEVEKVKNIPIGGEQRANPLKEALEKKMELIERAFRGKEDGSVVTLNVRAAAVMTTENTINEGDLPDDLIESFSVDAFVPKRRPRQYIFDVADRTTVGEIEKYTTWLEEGGEEGAFAIVAEGGLKPLVSLALVRNIAEAKKVAGKYVVTEEFTKFRKNAYSIIRRLVNDKLLRDYAALLTADLVAASAGYVGSALDGQYTNPTDYHAIGAVAAQEEALNFVPDTLLLNPQDKWRIGLSQNAEGTFYMNIPVYNPSGEIVMLGFRVITSNYVPVGTFGLGEAGLFKIEDESVTIRMGYGINVTSSGGNVTAVESDLDHNRFRVIAETYYKDWIATNHQGSWVFATFAEVKEALQAA